MRCCFRNAHNKFIEPKHLSFCLCDKDFQSQVKSDLFILHISYDRRKLNVLNVPNFFF